MAPSVIDAGSDGAHQAVALQFIEGAPAAGNQLRHVFLHGVIGPVKHIVQIVNDQAIDPRYPQPLNAVLVGPHDAVVAEIEDIVEG
jgi:hypothetical protein